MEVCRVDRYKVGRSWAILLKGVEQNEMDLLERYVCEKLGMRRSYLHEELSKKATPKAYDKDMATKYYVGDDSLAGWVRFPEGKMVSIMWESTTRSGPLFVEGLLSFAAQKKAPT